MTWTFAKMQGLGNDFVVVSRSALPEDAPERARALCDRHFGVGADGLVFVLPSEKGDVAMRIFNPDGTEAEQCGNAVRCVARYFFERISGDKRELTVETRRDCNGSGWRHRGDGWSPLKWTWGGRSCRGGRFPPPSTGRGWWRNRWRWRAPDFGLPPFPWETPTPSIPVEDAPSFPVEEWGPRLETHPLFPRKTNVEFITVRSPREIEMRVWERGVGQTLACGSGACAAVVASAPGGEGRTGGDGPSAGGRFAHPMG